MKKDIDTNLIKELLQTSTRQITPATLEKLRGARTRALDHQRVQSTIPVLAWLGLNSGKNNTNPMSRLTNLAIIVLFVACLISGVTFWHSYSTEREIGELDVAILTGDLPIHVYLD
jgi:hypothetical protein